MRVVCCIQEEESNEINFLLESLLGIKPDIFFNLHDAESFLTHTSDINLFIINNSKIDTAAVTALCNLLKKETGIIASKTHKNALPLSPLVILEDESFPTLLFGCIEDLIKKGTLIKSTGTSGHIKIRTKLLLSVIPLRGDIYIQLNEKKFIKLFHQGDNFDIDDWKKYTQQKGIEYLYIQRTQVQEFLEKYRLELEKNLTKTPSAPIGEIAENNIAIMEAIQEIAFNTGFTKETRDLVKTQMKVTAQTVSKNTNLSKILNKIDQSKGDYISVHSTLTGVIACALSSKMTWSSEATYQKLILAGFMHDLGLNNQKLAACSSIDEAEAGGFTEQEVKDFKKHANKASEIVQQFTEIPPDVDTIILQHHEMPDGSGFPRAIKGSYISPLASVFIVAHDVAAEYIRLGHAFNPLEYIPKALEKYPTSQFKKIIQLVSSI